MDIAIDTDTPSNARQPNPLAVAISPLADVLKDSTWTLHKKAETCGVIADLIKRRSSIGAYLAYLNNLLPVYEALESKNSWLEQWPSLKPYVNGQIYRCGALREDLANIGPLSLNKSLPKTAHTVHPAMQEYADQITVSSQTHCAGMLGHVYVRYLGDLNGGRILQRLVGNGLALDTSQLKFYQFPKIDDLAVFKDHFRGALNSVRLSAAQKNHAIAAAKNGFSATIAASIGIQATFAKGGRL